jgi:hypothetical protein
MCGTAAKPANRGFAILEGHTGAVIPPDRIFLCRTHPRTRAVPWWRPPAVSFV